MQYQSAMSREELEDLALNQYFANVDAKDLDAVLDCFHDISSSSSGFWSIAFIYSSSFNLGH